MGYFEVSDELQHHGIKGQKWGVRRFESANGHLTAAGKARYDDGKVSAKEKNAFSLKATGHKAMAKVYGMNEKVYKKSNKALSSMNEAAKKEQLKKAENAQKEANDKAKAKAKEMQKYKDVDPEAAKNKQTKRAAYDYHNMNELQFRGKYKTSKKTFAKRYEKSKGDTYSLGKKKQAAALALVGMMPAKSVYIGKGKTLQVTGAKAVAKSLMYDGASSLIGTNFGYKRAEKKYNEKHKGD